MIRRMKRLAAAGLALALTWASPVAAAVPAGVWTEFEGLWDKNAILTTDGRSFSQNADTGGVPRFRIRAGGSGSGGTSAAGRPSRFVEVESTRSTGPAGRDAASMMAGIASLDLPDAEGPTSLELYRGEGFRRLWGAERMLQTRAVAMVVDLDTAQASEAARICRSIAVERIAAVESDRCTLEAIVDRADGLPLAARITRVVAGDNRANVTESFTFIRSADCASSAPRN
jgi:hypothetical protein